MFVNQTVIFITFLLHVGLGVFVLWRNPANVVNRRFCLFTYALSVWTFSILFMLQATDPVLATFRLRLAFCAALFMPPAFFSFTSVFPDRAERSIDRYLSISFFAISAFLAFYSSYVVYIVESLSFEKRLPHAEYGPLFPIFWFYFASCTFYSLYTLYRKSVRYYGVKKLQVQYLYFGVAVSVLLGIITNFVLPAIGVWQVERFAPLVTVPIPVAVAYAIVKYHLMDITLVIKRSAVYGTLSIVLSATYFIVGLILGSILPVSEYKETVTTIVSTVVIVLTFVPTREFIQHITEKTLFHTKYSRPQILRDSTVMFSSIHDLNGLLRSAIQSLYNSVGIEKICILLKDEGSKHYSPRATINFSPEDNLFLASRNAVITWLCQNKTVLSVEQLNRFAQSKLDRLAEVALASLDVDSCIPVFRENDLFGIILLGKKVDKKPFTQEDVQMFLAFSGQLTMAIHSAHLYAGLKEAKTYRDNILQSLRSGVIVVDNNEEITLINNEAKRILGLKRIGSSGSILESLGEDTYQLLRYTLESDTEYHDIESSIERGGKKIPCGVTTVQLKTEAGEKLGALMILTDLTEMKLLQAEKQHADRLASVGAIAANVAHEIKNPLVAINTYFKLLPHKKNDEEFQRDFPEIATKELRRINRIIEEMLNLARPSPPIMQLIDPHCVIMDIINLLKDAAAEKGVEITKDFEEKKCQLIADEEKIKQVLINILQNGLDALPGNGRINVSTGLSGDLSKLRSMAKMHPGSVFFSSASPSPHDSSDRQYFIIKISDNGTGIPAEEMPRLFEPFFTTKDKGTGLGLAIAYGIIKDHRGGIYVESREGKGTDFYVCLPLAHINTGSSRPKVIEMPSA
ncbi:MAG: ATP-binding protein [Candidatus Brocadiales bacterium]